MKVFIALCLLCITVCKGDESEDSEEKKPIKCIQGDGTDKTAKDCTGDFAEATQCSQPKFVEFTGLSTGVPYACGPCPENTATTCEACTGKTDAACNTPKATGADYKCHDYELKDGKFEMKEELTTCKRLATTTTKCNMPGDVADENYMVKKKGCGGCPYKDRTAMRCAECDRAECNKKPIKCIQGDGSDLTAKQCVPESGKSPPVKCHQAKFIEYTGLTDQEFGCGPCDQSETAKCQDCEGNTDTACNTELDTIGRDFQCTNYEHKDGKFVAKKDKPKVTCKRLKTTNPICNKPGEESGDDYAVETVGHCGKCSDDSKAQKKCEDSDPVPIICQVGDGTSVKNATCERPSDDAEMPIKCHQTKFIQYVGLAGELNYGCGKCPANSETTCQECYGNTDKSCNTKIETNDDYECYDYEYKEDKFVAKKEMITCKRLKHTAPKCNMPGKNATSANYKNNGCGGCTAEEQKAVTCTECGSVACNGAYVAAITAIILPLVRLTLL